MTREEAINKLNWALDNNTIEDVQSAYEYIIALKMAIQALEQEPRKGHWVHGEYCSECGCDVPAYIIDWKWQKDMDAKYCPNCGCRMVEPQKSIEYL